MSPSQAGQDADVAVLKAQQSTLENSIREIAKTMSEGFASINTKMDRVNDIALNIAQMSGRQEAHSDGLQRAFGEMKSLREMVERHIDESAVTADKQARETEERFTQRDALRANYLEQHAREHAEINSRMATAKGILIGATMAYGLLVGVLTWAASTYVGQTRSNTEKIHDLQLNEARHPRTSP